MKIITTVAAAAASLLAGCAGTPVAPSGMVAGSFVTLGCQGGKMLQARYAADGRSVRVRALHGSTELERRPDGSFAADDYELTAGSEGWLLKHKGKPEAQGCKSSA